MRLVQRLPTSSHYMAAVANDEELAKQILQSQDSNVTPIRRGPDFAGWTREVDLLTAILEAVLRLTAITVGANSKDHKVPKVKPLPRPRTAVDRVKLRQAEEETAAVVAALKPRE